jgi:hypothetical protein
LDSIDYEILHISDFEQFTDDELADRIKEEAVLKAKADKLLDQYRDKVTETKSARNQISQNIRFLQRHLTNRIEGRKNQKAKEDAFSSYPNIPDHIREKVWSKAYEKSHSEGLQAVKDTFDDLMELFV